VTPQTAKLEAEPVRTGHSVEALMQAFLDNLFYVQARFREVASENDDYLALAYTVRDRLLHRWIRSARCYKERGARTVCYLSAEFLIGPQLGSNLLNLDLEDNVREAMRRLDIDLDRLLECEPEPGLGSGGLGRLAACYMDSLATLRVPAIGYGIRYEYGIFEQRIQDGWQTEFADRWLRLGNPWEIARPEIVFTVPIGGRVEHHLDASGRLRVEWHPARIVKGMAYDIPLPGYGVDNANMLRLFASTAPEAFDLETFNCGDYVGAVDQQIEAQNLSKVLYPSDEQESGRRLRLRQQHFLVSCALQDMIRIHQQGDAPLDDFPRKYAVQLNDTHPSLAVLELMRLLLDEHAMDWDRAWDITTRSFAYTNHTLLPEALETWPVALFAEELPRHLELLFELNRRFLDEVRIHFPGDEARVRRMSLIDEEGGRRVRMAHLACAGSFAVNGVAELHTRLLRERVLGDFHELWPTRLRSVTNGVTQRRFVRLANPRLSALITELIGEGWLRDATLLAGLEAHADDPGLAERWRGAKRASREQLAAYLHGYHGIAVDPGSMFDVQVKRIHEYKRQLLNVVRVVADYLSIKHDPASPLVPRTIIFGGKAAPAYRAAKLVIKLIHAVAGMLHADPSSRDRLRVVFVPDFNVKRAMHIYPAADLSEQISLAGMEASGTGNMKLGLNGALTIGTLDGANVEIRERVGEDNFFLFGMDAEQVAARDGYRPRPRRIYEKNARLREALDLIGSGFFSHGDAALFRPLLDELLERDRFCVLADFQEYVEAQARVEAAWREPAAWTRMSILNTARMGYFSSDRAIAEYMREIWTVEPVPV